MDISVGQSIGRYRITEQLGEGSLTIVLKAHDTSLERDVTIKLFRREMLHPVDFERFRLRFGQEVKAFARLSHPNIVRLLDYGEQDGLPYLVVDYLSGGSLKKFLGSPISYQQAALLLAPIAGALSYAHDENILHGDVKPSSILMTHNGIPMLSDFGLARIVETEGAQPASAILAELGTPGYTAPEQWKGKTLPQSDVYALGAIFYELVTGRNPYAAETPAEVLQKQAADPISPPTYFVPDLPEEVERVMYQALARRPEDRYKSMKDFAAVLEKFALQARLPQFEAEDYAVSQAAALAVGGPKEQAYARSGGGFIQVLLKFAAVLLAVLAVGSVWMGFFKDKPAPSSPWITKIVITPHPTNTLRPTRTGLPSSTATITPTPTPSPLPSFTPILTNTALPSETPAPSLTPTLPEPSQTSIGDAPKWPALMKVNQYLRPGPSIYFKILKPCPINTTLEVLSTEPKRQWFVVRCREEEGWLLKTWLEYTFDPRSLPLASGIPATPVPPTLTPPPADSGGDGSGGSGSGSGGGK